MFDDTPLPFDGQPTPPPENISNEDTGKNWKKPAPQQPTNQQVNQKTGEVMPPPKPPKNTVIVNSVLTKSFQGLLVGKSKTLENFLGNQKNAMRFMSAVVHSVEKVPDLMKCDERSLMAAFMECAAIGLYPGTASGDCYVLPYAGKAQFQLGYKGIRTLAYASGVLRLWAEIVYEHDYFKQVLGSDPRIEHSPAEDDERGEPVGAYACAEISKGNVIFKYMPKSKIMDIKDKSPSKTSKYSPWNSSTDVDLWMWKKSVIKQLGKMLPQSPTMARAIHLDNISERGGYFEPSGAVHEVPFEESQEQKINKVEAKKEALRKAKKK